MPDTTKRDSELASNLRGALSQMGLVTRAVEQAENALREGDAEKALDILEGSRTYLSTALACLRREVIA